MAGTKVATPDTSRGRDAVDAVLDELDRLAAGESGAEQFYGELLSRLGSLGFRATAIWQLAGGEARLERHSAGTNGELASPAQLIAIQEAIDVGRPKVLAASGASGRSLIAPWKIADAPAGALQVWPGEGAPPAADEGYLRLLAAIAEIVALFRTRQEQKRLRQELDQQGRLGPFTESLHASLDAAEVAYRIANDGRVLLGCDRMAVAVRRGRRYKVTSVSGAEHVHRRSESVRQLERLCERVVATGEPLWHDGSAADLLPQVSVALDDYLEVSPAIALAVIPLSGPETEQTAALPPVGVLICEQYAKPFSPGIRSAVGSVAGHCRLALTNARRVESIPAHQMWLALGREGVLSKWAFRSLVAAALLAVVVTVLLLVPADVQVKARGELQPAVRHEVFAPRDGVVTAIHVDHGAQVKASDQLLEIRSPELDLELQRVAGELETKRKQLAAAQSERLQFKPGDPELRLKQRRLTADEEQYQEEVRGLAQRLTMLQRQHQELTVRSPVAGEVITWDAQQRLATRPLRRGDALLTIADASGPWQLELRVPSRLAGRFLAAWQAGTKQNLVSFQLAAEPGKTLTGTVTEVAERVETDDAGESYLLVTVDLPGDLPVQRVPGATAVARITCGRGSLGEAWFYELVDAARLWLPF